MMRREPPPDPSLTGDAVQLATDTRRSARPAACRATQNAEQSAGGEFSAELEPGFQLGPGPAVHPDLATLVTLSVADEQRATVGIEVGLGQRQALADPQPSAPEHHDHPAQAQPVGMLAGGTPDGDDLLDRSAGPAGTAALCCEAVAPGGRSRVWPANGAGRRSPTTVRMA
jgi:hypothetical protein